VNARLYTDGAARGNPGPAGSGAALVAPDGTVIAEVTRFLGHATNNVAEYTALIIGLQEASRRGVDHLDVRMDSLLVVQQMKGLWRIKHPGLKPLPSRTIEHIPREENGIADALANRAIDQTMAQGRE